MDEKNLFLIRNNVLKSFLLNDKELLDINGISLFAERIRDKKGRAQSGKKCYFAQCGNFLFSLKVSK